MAQSLSISARNRAGLKHRKNEISREFFLKIFDDAFRSAGLERFIFETCKLFLLADVGAKRDDLRPIIIFEPTENDGGIESARICENDLHKELIVDG